MKRFVLPLGLALALVAAGIYLLRRAPHAPRVAEWLPGGTILYEEMPDLHRTQMRWPQTALGQIINEPQVQAFLERPLGQLPKRGELDERMAQMGRIDPTRFFLAVTDWGESTTPKVIAGLSYAGSKDELDGLVDELRKGAEEMWPGGKSDIETYGTGEIETFTAPNVTVALAYREKWLFIATDEGLLKATLDRYGGMDDPASLAKLPAYQSCLEHLPDGPDNMLFVRPALLADKAASLMLMLNPTADMSGTEKLKQIDAMGFEMKMEGERMRDGSYVIEQQPGEETALARDILKVSSTDTIAAGGGRMEKLNEIQLPDPKSDPSGLVQMIESDLKVFSDQGLGVEQMTQAFGPETGFLLDWPQGAMAPDPMVMMDVRDVAEARKFLDTLATLPLAAGVSFTRQDQGGISFYTLPQTGMGFVNLQVTLGLTGHCVIGALNMDAVKQAAQRWDAGKPGLAAAPVYQNAQALVDKPTIAFSYLDTKAFFDRVYGPIRTFSGLASMGFVPHLADYVDVGKLPAPEVIERHLSPIVSSAAVKDGGLLTESTGPVTTTQMMVGTALVFGAAAVPVLMQQGDLIQEQMNRIQQQMKDEAKDEAKTMSGLQHPNPFASPSNPAHSASPSGPPAIPPPVLPSAPAPSASASGGSP